MDSDANSSHYSGMNDNRQLVEAYNVEELAAMPGQPVFLPMLQMFPAIQQPPAPVQPPPAPIQPADQLTEPIEEEGNYKTTRLVVCAHKPPSRDGELVVGLTVTNIYNLSDDR